MILKTEVDQLITEAEEEFAKLTAERAKVLERLKKLWHERSQIDRPSLTIAIIFQQYSLHE